MTQHVYLVVMTHTASIEKAEFLAKKWGSQVVHAGAKGHINLASNLGVWEEGRKVLRKILDKTKKE